MKSCSFQLVINCHLQNEVGSIRGVRNDADFDNDTHKSVFRQSTLSNFIGSLMFYNHAMTRYSTHLEHKIEFLMES
jgi:hypothetical protein